RQRGMLTVFELCSLPTEHHARARQLPCIPNRRRGNPNRRQRSRPLQSVHPFGIELVAFVHTAHHQFRQPCINQLRFSSSLLNLIHYPIPVPHHLHRHRRLSFPPVNKVLNAPMSVLQSTLVQLFSLCILYPYPGVLLVNIQCDVFHNCSPPRSLIVTTAVTEYLAFILIRMTFVCLSHCDTVSSAGENKRRSARFSIAITHEQLTVKLEESPYPEASSGRAAANKSPSP